MAGGNNGSSYQKYDGASGTYQAPSEPEVSPASFMSKYGKILTGVLLVALFGTIYGVTSTHKSHRDSESVHAKAIQKALEKNSIAHVQADGHLKLFDELNRFVLEDFDAKTTFSSFLPGVAGYFGKPVWAFYVNRGQGIATFGEESKDYPILEFNAANKAYQMTPFWGFRTFISVNGGAVFEPFDATNARKIDNQSDNQPKRVMYVGRNDMEIQEANPEHGIITNVHYFVLPEDDFAALVRRTTITNLGEDDITIDLLDGLAKMEPFGGRLDGMLKSMGRTLEGWMGVYHADDSLTMPFYKLSTEPSDSASVKIEEAGHYCLSFIESETEQSKLLPIVFDTDKVFGEDTSLGLPRGLDKMSIADILANPQYGFAKTSSAFAAVTSITIPAGANITIASVYGKADQISVLSKIGSHVTVPKYISGKAERARTLIQELTEGVETTTVHPLFDGTVQQMYLDNSLRGGMPTILGNVDADTTYDEDPGVKVFHSFSRIHGDLERDYNAFKIEPTFFSQGPGNYRDIAQNRRNDVTFTPRMGSFNVQMFLSFIQADGYEPLTVEAVVFRFEDPDEAVRVARKVTNDVDSAKVLGEILKGGAFRPGQLFGLCESLKINLSVENDVFINTIIASAQDRAMAVYGSGYWADHWDYYIDLIETYLSIFPDGEEQLMYDKPLRYFFSTATVKPRSQKYVLELTFDGKSHHVLQLDSTYYDQQKVSEQEAFRSDNTGLLGIEANWQRTNEGQPFMSSAIAKLLLLGSIKFAMRDAYGMGIEYEGGRPGWLDSMNGLPGMVGSGMPETYELYLLLEYVKKVVDKYDRDVVLPIELGKMINVVEDALDALDAVGYTDPDDLPVEVPKPLFEYWDHVAAARESYRNDVEYYFSGNTTSYSSKHVSKMVGRWLSEIEKGVARSFKFATIGFGDDGTSGIPACFFSYDVTEWEKNGNKNDVGLPLVNAKAMKVRSFPLFLEGPVRYMKTVKDDHSRMLDIYERVKESGLRDTVLNMYFLSASLKGQSYDMGRQIAFAPGWLENQSIWMHMSYKYYLQMLRGQLYEQFFDEMKSGGILPFMDPMVYGRSLMECSSFIASSAFPDPSIVGKGFLARLSGSTAEFMDIWKHMFIGPEPFFINDDGKLEMQLVPALPSWLFEDDGESSLKPMLDDDGAHTVNFKLFASIPVTYHNPGAKDLFGVNPKKYVVVMADDTTKEIDGPTISEETAKAIRRVKTVKSIDAYF